MISIIAWKVALLKEDLRNHILELHNLMNLMNLRKNTDNSDKTKQLLLLLLLCLGALFYLRMNLFGARATLLANIAVDVPQP